MLVINSTPFLLCLNPPCFRLSPDRLTKKMSVPGLGVGAPEVNRYDDGVDGGDDEGDDDVGEGGGGDVFSFTQIE